MSISRRVSVVALSLCLSATLGYIAVLANPSTLKTVVWSIGVIWILAPFLVSRAKRIFDILEPIWLAAIAMAIMFFLRPLRLLADGVFVHRGIDFRATMEPAALLVLVGSVSFLIGYALPVSSRVGNRIRPLPEEWHSSTVTLAATALVVVGSGLFLLFLAQSGGIASLLWLATGRAPGQDLLFRNSSGYLYQGPLLLVPAGLLFFAEGCVSDRRSLKILGLLTIVPIVLFNFGGGGRTSLLIVTGTFIVFWMLWNDYRPSVVQLVVGGYLVLTIGVGFLGIYRSTDLRHGSLESMLATSLMRPDQALARLTTGGDADMFDTLANIISVVPSKLPFQHGSVLVDPLIRMIPRQLWPSGIKPMEANDKFVSMLWPAQYSITRAGPASSFIGQLYQDSGWLSVIVGMALLGIMLAASWKWRERWKTNPSVQLTYAAILPYVVVLLRGNFTTVLSTGLFTFMPVIFVLSVAGKRQFDRASAARWEHLPGRLRFEKSRLEPIE